MKTGWQTLIKPPTIAICIIVLQKLWDINGNISDKYSVLKRCQLKVCDQGNATLNMKKMESDFYFSTFDPIGHFTLQRSTCSDAHAGIQKKFVPWKGMFQVEEELSSKGEIIVVASLIDKPPNLGGLARTCEVFSAAELVLGSLKFVEDKQFTSLSLTAEKHINISEVRPHNLDQYLRSMKDLGYSIVGAEQTSDSIPLSEFEFPTKTVLVLG
ncbi:hypothetical protein AAG570_006390 [Ranatra chinensis]|uniref:tRNA/rRNA methyltransferase SpoU type domain-containing protein n=1 Tax=Ranatra chinensis TaxID=642074 RepID=A0ABD0YTX8_9HEMI